MRFLRSDISGSFGFGITELDNLKAKLDQNECARELPGELKELIKEELFRFRLNRYPQPRDYHEAKGIFAEAAGFKPENVFLTVGCDQVIMMAFWLSGGPGRKALIFEPTYPMFAHSAMITGTEAIRVNLGPDFVWDTSYFKPEIHLINIVTPNNPTGHLAGDEVVEAALKTGSFVFVDEAYHDFSGKSYSGFLEKYENMMIGRSLAKSGLAGVRLGYGVSGSEIVTLAEGLLFIPYHLNFLQLAVARAYPKIKPFLADWAREVNLEKERLYRFFDQEGIEYQPSFANFVLFRVPDPKRTYDCLIGECIRIRNTSSMKGLEGWLRVTIGTKEEMDCFMEALRKAL
ncbi:MAG: aminotransferase class I/II-fold pyridoxal phosphate-dependent enzyme [candidate division WOR-3 bacterium]